MKAVVRQDAFKVAVQDVADAKIENPTDALIRITTTNICGSDLHMYEGRTSVEQGKVLGHENMGVIEEIGPAVTQFTAGDRVSVPFNIGCVVPQLPDRLVVVLHPDEPDRRHGRRRLRLCNMGPYDGGQAEYLRVPHADFNLLRLPQGTEHENDFTMLSDIFPTGWHGVELSGMIPGDRVAVFGAGPVGLMAAHAALIKGASQVFVVDQQQDRLDLAAKTGAQPIDFSKGDPSEQIIDATDGIGADRGVEAVGYQAHDHSGEEHPELVLDNLINSVRATGGIGVVGVYMPEDEGASSAAAKEGRIGFQYGTFFTKGQSMGTRQAPVNATTGNCAT